MKILVTGGAGYIGSHTCVELLQAGYSVIVVDNFSNSNPEALSRVEEITGKSVTLYEVDLLDAEALEKVFANEEFEAIIHFAALKAVGESVEIPLKYYMNNLVGTLNLCEMMIKYDVKNFIFSSSATVYGDPEEMPVREDFPVSATNPYGWTKLMMEQILKDVQHANPAWNVIILRYFNPVGAHISGRIGEDPNGIPNNLMPYISQVAIGRLEKLSVFGNDYATVDGTGVRDYIHVVDLARGHLAALKSLDDRPGLETYNLGTGKGYSVLEVITAFEKASHKKIPHQVVARRAGDVAESFADPSKANKKLHWKAEYDIDRMCADTWRWQTMNPHGYENV
jgi:UDP-glucose 4-epimerase